MKEFYFNISEIHATDDADLLLKEHNTSSYVNKLLERMYYDVQKRKSTAIENLYKYIKRYPKEPAFKNYLSVAYGLKGDIKKAFEVNQRIVKEHPEYLFGKVNLANEFINTEEPKKVLPILGENLRLQELYPDRELFHIDEVITYYIAAVKYLFLVELDEQAEDLMNQLETVYPDHHKLEALGGVKTGFLLKRVQKRVKEEEKLRIEVELIDRRSHLQTTVKSTFHFPELIDKLYTTNLEIADELLIEILDLPKEQLEEDLINVLQDSIYRFDYFNLLSEEKGWNDKQFSFPTHALYLLFEIGTKKSLPILLEILRQENEFTYFWYGDSIQEVLTPVLLKLGKDNLNVLLDFVKENNVYCFNKGIVTTTVKDLAYIKPNRNDEVVLWFQELLDFCITNKENVDFIDTDFIGLLIGDVMYLKNKIFLPKIKILFDFKLVGYWICGDYNEVEKHVLTIGKEKSYIDSFLTLTCTKELYQNYLKKWNKNTNFEENLENENHPYFEEETEKNTQIINTIKKIGRNDPCHCGSGKKHKKCCLNV